MLGPYLETVIGHDQRGFQRSMSTGQIREEKWESREGRGCIGSRGDEQKTYRIRLVASA
jgi:hypothetical protein